MNIMINIFFNNQLTDFFFLISAFYGIQVLLSVLNEDENTVSYRLPKKKSKYIFKNQTSNRRIVDIL